MSSSIIIKGILPSIPALAKKSHLCSWFLLTMLLVHFSSLDIHAQRIREIRSNKGYGMFFTVGAGLTPSMAENSSREDFFSLKQGLPSVEVGLGYSFTSVFAFRVNGAIKPMASRCGKAVCEALPEIYGDGIYKMRMSALSASILINATNLFVRTPERDKFTLSMIAGGGMIKTGNFEKEKMDLWNQKDYYPVSTDEGTFPTGHLGLQGAFSASNKLDLTLEFRVNATDNAFNGVNNSSDVDFFADLMFGLTYYFKERPKTKSKGVQVVSYTDPLLLEINGEEVAKRGATMQTTIPFYTGFYFVNNLMVNKMAKVYKTLKRYPDMKICVVGHPDIVDGQDETKNLDLAKKRAEAVKNTLVEKYGIEESRIRTDQKNEALVPIESAGDWIPAVSFVME